mmetsp:Transcript_20354/g.43677  ORF Transcript_20354/g.43677 Transcript_20354/m.43677 type:complete len:90 (+) Transcript_20354:269-538(+)
MVRRGREAKGDCIRRPNLKSCIDSIKAMPRRMRDVGALLKCGVDLGGGQHTPSGRKIVAAAYTVRTVPAMNAVKHVPKPASAIVMMPMK